MEKLLIIIEVYRVLPMRVSQRGSPSNTIISQRIFAAESLAYGSPRVQEPAANIFFVFNFLPVTLKIVFEIWESKIVFIFPEGKPFPMQ